MQVIPEERSLHGDAVLDHSSREDKRLISHASSPAMGRQDFEEISSDQGLLSRMSVWATRLVLPSPPSPKSARPVKDTTLEAIVSDFDVNACQNISDADAPLFMTGHAPGKNKSLVASNFLGDNERHRASRIRGSATIQSSARHSSKIRSFHDTDHKISEMSQKLDIVLHALRQSVVIDAPSPDKSKSILKRSKTLNSFLEDKRSKSLVAQPVEINLITHNLEAKKHTDFLDPNDLPVKHMAKVSFSTQPPAMKQIPRKMSVEKMITNGQESASFSDKSKMSSMKLFSAKHFADVVTMAKEGQLARVQGESGFKRVVQLNHNKNTSYNSYTDPKLRWYVLLPDSTFRTYWGLFICFVVLYYSIAIPLVVAFPINIPIGVEIIFTFLFFLDLCIQFLFAYRITTGEDAGSIETRIPWIAQKYILSWFVIDLMSSIPLDLVDPDRIQFRLLRLTRLLRVPRVMQNFDDIAAGLSLEPSHILLGKLVMALMLILHWIACIYWFISNDDEVDAGDFLPSIVEGSDDQFYNYSVSLVWAIWATTGGGCVGHPGNSAQAIFTFICALVGVLMYAFIVGSASAAINDLDSVNKRRRNRLQHMREYLIQRGLDKHFIKQVMSYYEYCWERNLQTEDENLFQGLHTSLQRSMDIAILENVVLKVPMFRDISRPCLERLIENMEPRIYLPKEYVIVKDEWGQEMFFIVRGKFEVLVEENGEPLVTLTSGQSFGEMALLQKKRRNSSVRSVNHGELMCLEMEPFISILRDFPIFAISLQKWSPHVRLSRGWRKIAHAVRLCRLLGENGIYQSFESMLQDMNATKNNRHQGGRFLKEPKQYVNSIFMKNVLL